MKHYSGKRSFGRKRNQRKALMSGLVRSLVEYGRIETTEAKAKELRPAVEKLVTKAKSGTLASIRLIASRIDVDTARKLVNEVAPKYAERAGGYTRITKLPPRNSDSAKMAVIEFV